MSDATQITATPETPTTLDPALAAQKLVECYRRGGGESFLDDTLRNLEDPIEPQTPKGKRKYHPLLVSGVVLLVLVVATFLYFTFRS